MGNEQREFYGKVVRMVWVEWAREQPNPKPSWLLPWDELTEPEREVDRRIGEKIAELSSIRASQPAQQATEKREIPESVADAHRDHEGICPLCYDLGWKDAQCGGRNAAVAQSAAPQEVMGFLVLSGLFNLGSFYHAHMREEADKHVASLANTIGGETARAVPLYAAAPSMAPVGTEREAFETWARTQPWVPSTIIVTPPYGYRNVDMQAHWETWQAARTAPVGDDAKDAATFRCAGERGDDPRGCWNVRCQLGKRCHKIDAARTAQTGSDA